MAKQFSFRRPDHWEIAFWLTFNNSGDVRLTRGQPALAANECAMAVRVNLPHSLFRTPQLSATITLGEKLTPDAHIDLQAAEQALTDALGARVEITIANGEQQP